MTPSQLQQDVISLLKKAGNILVLPSSPIDGDCLGSSLALYLALKKMGKEVTIVAEETIPANYNFLPQISVITDKLNFVRDFIVTIDLRDGAAKNVRHEIQGNKINIIVTPEKGSISQENISLSRGGTTYDCIVTVDAADPSQLGSIYENSTELFQLVPVINIDHHVSNISFGKFNLVDVMAPSTTTLILPLIEELGPLMDADIATLLLAGLITDTGSFQNPNTTPDAFAIAAKLIGFGARQQEIIRNIYKTKKLSTLRLWGRTLTKIQFNEELHMVWSVLTARDFAEIGGGPDETEGVIDELMSNAPGAEIIFLLKEKGPNEVSGSVRTLNPAIDASKLAGLLGGGGHMQAAGFRMKGKSIEEAEKDTVAAFGNFQKKRLRIDSPEMPPVPAIPTPAAPPITRPPVMPPSVVPSVHIAPPVVPGFAPATPIPAPMSPVYVAPPVPPPPPAYVVPPEPIMPYEPIQPVPPEPTPPDFSPFPTPPGIGG